MRTMLLPPAAKSCHGVGSSPFRLRQICVSPEMCLQRQVSNPCDNDHPFYASLRTVNVTRERWPSDSDTVDPSSPDDAHHRGRQHLLINPRPAWTSLVSELWTISRSLDRRLDLASMASSSGTLIQASRSPFGVGETRLSERFEAGLHHLPLPLGNWSIWGILDTPSEAPALP